MDSLKMISISLYLLLIYSVSIHFPDLSPLFFPTLGAFSYLFISKAFAMRDMLKLIGGATCASLIGSCFFLSHTGGVAFLVTSLTTIWIIRRFALNAPPILAVALIPYFSQPAQWWTVPVSVLASLTGLVIVLLLTEWLAVKVQRLRQPAGAAEKASSAAP